MSTNTFIVSGVSGHLWVPTMAIPAAYLLAFGYYQQHLPEFCLANAEKILGMVALFTLALLLVGLFLRSRRVEVQGDRLRYRSWFSDRTIPAHVVTAVSFDTETTVDDDSFHTENFLTLWRGRETLLRLNVRLWPRSGLVTVLDWLHRNAPSIRFDLAVERYRSRHVSH